MTHTRFGAVRRPPAIPLASLLASNPKPAGIFGNPRADRSRERSRDPAAMIADLQEGFEDFKDRHNGHLTNAQAAIDEINAKLATVGVSGAAGASSGPPPDPEYTQLFASFVRGGENESQLKAMNAKGERQMVNAAMSVGSNGDGGYLAPTEWDRQVRKALLPVSPIRTIANVQETQVRAFTTLWRASGWGSGWVGEAAARAQTSTPTLAPLEFAAGEIYANPAITQGLLDDAEFNVQSWLATEVADEFAKQEGIAFVSGNGVNKPFGFLTYVAGGAADGRHPGGNLVVVPSGAAAALPGPDGLVDFVYSLPSPYRANARWVMNSTTAAAIAKMKDGQGNFIWREGLVQGQPATLLGYPVTIDEDMPAVAAGNLPVAFGDFRRGYLINDRFGVRLLRDPYTNKPYVNFYSTKRVGGGVLDPLAIRLLKIAAS